MLLDDGEPGGWRGRWLLGWPVVEVAGVVEGGRLTFGEARGVSSPVARNGERVGGRWRLWWAWTGEVGSLVARR